MLIGHESVTNARFGQQVAGLRRNGLELAPQARNIYSKGAYIAPVRPPDFLQQLRVGDDAVCSSDQAFKDSVFEGSQSHIPTAGSAYRARSQVHDDLPQLDARSHMFATRHPARDGLDAREKLGTAERLCNVIVDTRLKCGKPLILLRARSEHDDRNGRPSPDLLDEPESVPIRKAQVKNANVRSQGLRAPDPGLTVLNSGDAKSVSLKQYRENRCDTHVVLDDENAIQRLSHRERVVA